MDESALRRQLIDEGFTRVFVHSDPPGFVYDEHRHTSDHAQVVLEGAIEVIRGDERRVYGPGER